MYVLHDCGLWSGRSTLLKAWIMGERSSLEKNSRSCLKGTVSRDFRHFFINKLQLAPYERAKKVSQNFLFSRRYLQTMWVRVFIDYADTVSALSLTTQIHGKLFYFGKVKNWPLIKTIMVENIVTLSL